MLNSKGKISIMLTNNENYTDNIIDKNQQTRAYRSDEALLTNISDTYSRVRESKLEGKQIKENAAGIIEVTNSYQFDRSMSNKFVELIRVNGECKNFKATNTGGVVTLELTYVNKSKTLDWLNKDFVINVLSTVTAHTTAMEYDSVYDFQISCDKSVKYNDEFIVKLFVDLTSDTQQAQQYLLNMNIQLYMVNGGSTIHITNTDVSLSEYFIADKNIDNTDFWKYTVSSDNTANVTLVGIHDAYQNIETLSVPNVLKIEGE